MMINEASFDEAILLAQRVFKDLDAKGSRWKNRNVPIYIREKLWVPYYLTEIDGQKKLYVIRPPDRSNPRVHFKEYR